MSCVDSFSSELHDKQHGNAEAVFREVVRGGRFSTFEATSTLMATLKHLIAAGRIVEVKSDYPWHTYRLAKKP